MTIIHHKKSGRLPINIFHTNLRVIHAIFFFISIYKRGIQYVIFSCLPYNKIYERPLKLFERSKIITFLAFINKQVIYLICMYFMKDLRDVIYQKIGFWSDKMFIHLFYNSCVFTVSCHFVIPSTKWLTLHLPAVLLSCDLSFERPVLI